MRNFKLFDGEKVIGELSLKDNFGAGRRFIDNEFFDVKIEHNSIVLTRSKRDIFDGSKSELYEYNGLNVSRENIEIMARIIEII